MALSRHCRVHHGQEPEILLHGDEHKTAGGASSDRNGDRSRPGGVAAEGDGRSVCYMVVHLCNPLDLRHHL